MRERRRGRVRWGRAAVRWVVVSALLMAVGAGVVVRAGSLGIPRGWIPGSVDLQEPCAQNFECLRVARLSALRTFGSASFQGTTLYQVWTTEDARPARALTAWLTDEELVRQAPSGLRGAARRLRDVLGEMRGQYEELDDVVGVDVRAGPVPMGMVIQRTHGTEPVVVPAKVRGAYPIVIAMDGGARCVLIRAWSIAGWSVAIGAVVAFVPPALVGARRMVRRRGGRCVWCGYSRVGLAEEARCPECGESE